MNKFEGDKMGYIRHLSPEELEQLKRARIKEKEKRKKNGR